MKIKTYGFTGKSQDDLIGELESALSALDSNDFSTWVACGIALAELGDAGFSLWDSWSHSSPRYRQQDAAKRWRTFKPTRTGYRAIFAKARRAGWRPEAPLSPAPAQPAPTTPKSKLKKAPSALREHLAAIWAQTLPIDFKATDSVARYLAARGLSAIAADPPDNLRHHPTMAYWTTGKVPTLMGRFPAMVARVQNAAGELTALHVTYVTDDGQKAPVPSPRKVRGTLPPGSAIRLYPHGHHLALAEGIETALALRISADLWHPIWSMISAGGLANFTPPTGVTNLDIFADRDRSEAGIKAARTLQGRMNDAGIGCRIYMPSDEQCREVFALRGDVGKSVDWADILHHGGHL